jgi:hypothetical protein
VRLENYVLSWLTTFSDDVFSSRASVDSIFHSGSMAKVKTTDVLLIGNDDGTFSIQYVTPKPTSYLVFMLSVSMTVLRLGHLI